MRTLLPLFRCLLAILIVVLPVQGSAAMLMSYSAGVAMADGMHNMHNMHAAGDTTAAAMPAMAGEGHCSHAPGPERKAKSAHIKCNAGANCCAGAVAPPSAPSRLALHLTSTEKQAAREPAMTVFVPPALERPPRLA